MQRMALEDWGIFPLSTRMLLRSRVHTTLQGARGASPSSFRCMAALNPGQGEEDADWKSNQIRDSQGVGHIAATARRVAVLGIKTEAQAGQPAFEVAAYLQRAGIEVVPVPVFYPDVTEILGQPVVRRVQDVPEGPIDIVCVFRKPSDVPPHVPDILAAKNRIGTVWLQSGITNPAAEEELAKAGLKVVSDRCLMVEHRVAKL